MMDRGCSIAAGDRHISFVPITNFMFKTYILESEAGGRYYIGSCNDVHVRLVLHNTGKVRSTKPYLPWQVVYSEKFQTRKEAVQREKQIKSWKRRESIEKLFKNL